MISVFYLIIAAGLLAVTIWSISLLRRSFSLGALLMVLPTAALIYDNLIAGLGSTIGQGQLLQTLSVGRYLGHVFLPALWIYTALALAHRSGIAWPGREWVRWGSWLLILLLTVAMIFTDLAGMSLVVEYEGDALRYVNENRFAGPPIAATTMTLLVIGLGVAVWRRSGWPWMAAGALFMLLAGTVLHAALGSVATNIGELLFATSLVATEAHVQAVERAQDKKSPGQ